jgi:hypothetical protein
MGGGNSDTTELFSATAMVCIKRLFPKNGVYHRTVDPSASTGEESGEVSIDYHYCPQSLINSR